MEKPRLRSLDVFRGLTICLMIIVNTMGAGAAPYPVLEHASWLGFTAADAVFPSFLFAMGTAMAFTMNRDQPANAFLYKVVRRTAIIFLLGFLMYWFPFVHREGTSWALNPLAGTRIMGVLQRIALCYGLAAVIARYLKPYQLIILAVILLFGYWAVLVVSGPAGDPFNKLDNSNTRLDVLVLGRSHMWPWDDGFEPEGLLGTIPSTVNVLAGYLIGTYIRKTPASWDGLGKMVFIGTAMIMVSLFWNLSFPISKKLWTSSFVCLTIGIDVVVLMALIGLIDIAKVTAGVRFFEIPGKNPLPVYLFSEMSVSALSLIKVSPGDNPLGWIGIQVFQKLAPGPLGSLLFAVVFLLVCWLFGYLLDRNRIYLRI